MAMVARKPMIGSRDVWTRSRCTLQAQAKPHHTHKNVRSSFPSVTPCACVKQISLCIMSQVRCLVLVPGAGLTCQ
eukprot:scaffold257380_cov18-Tisochrysis_lutea.AAC.4